MLAEVESPLGTEVSEQWLPSPSSNARGDSFASRERRKNPLHRQLRSEIVEEIRSVVAAPQLGTDQYVGTKRTGVLERLSGSTPAVDTSVKVKRRDTHIKTLRLRGRGM
jgi:hypothetical protein